jgi:hypothetical protein
MASMALVLLRAVPGNAPAVDRIAFITDHPWLFRLAWIPWQLCAVIDLLQALAMLRTPWLAKKYTIAIAILTLCAAVPEQFGEARWDLVGVELAQRDHASYLAFEQDSLFLTSVVGAFFYTLAAIFWSIALARAGVWSRALTALSIATWSAMLAAVAAAFLDVGDRIVGAINGAGFLLLQLWLALACEIVLRRRRPDEAWGRRKPWLDPSRNVLFELAASSRFLELFARLVPTPAMKSDITDVLYVNYLVDAEVVLPLVPKGLELQRLADRYALFTFLTYRHGHFGPAVLGPLRKLCPSPLQTNWRIHVVDPRTKHRGVTFITNAVDDVRYALLARLTTWGMPMHRLAHASLTKIDHIRIDLDPGSGSAPDANVDVTACETPKLDGAWRECFGDWRGFLEYCVPQDRALATDVARGFVARHEINLGIPLAACVPYDGTVVSRAARSIAGDAKPCCFYVPRVAFSFSVEAHDALEGRNQ